MTPTPNMIHQFRNRKCVKLLWLAMAVYLFNISVDFVAPHANAPEDLSINKIESVAELIVEEIAQIDDFFDEQAESDRGPITKRSISLIYILSSRCEYAPLKVQLRKHYPAAHLDFFESTTKTILSPPPRLA